MRSVLRWLRRLALGVVLLAIVVIGGALVIAHTAWGREQLRERVEEALQEAFPGGAHIGVIEGSILGTLTVHDVELDGRDHKPLVTIGTLDVAVALPPLLVQIAQVDKLVADNVHVFAHREPPAAPKPPAAPSPWWVELPHVEIHHAVIEIETADTKQTLAELEGAGAATASAAGIALFGWAHGRWQDRATELTASAAVVIDRGVHVPAAVVMLGGAMPGANGDPSSGTLAAITATDLEIDLEHPSGAIAVSAPVRVLGKLVPELESAGVAAERLGDVAATIDVVAATPTTTRLVVNAMVGETTVSAALHGELAEQTARGSIWAHAVDLGLVTRGRVGGSGDLFAMGTGHRADGKVFFDLSRLAATSRIVEVRDRRVSGALAVNATATGTLSPALDVAVTGVGRGDTVAVETIAAALPACGGASARACDRQRSTVEISSVRVPSFSLRITPGVRPGAAPAIDLTGKVAGETVTYNDFAIVGVNGSFAGHLVAGVLLGEAHVTATRIRNHGAPIGAAHVDLEAYADIEKLADGRFSVAATYWPLIRGLEIFARALVTPGDAGETTVATFDRTRVTLPNGMIWAGRGGAVVMTDAMFALGGVTMRNGDATVAMRGEVTRSTGALTAHVDADQFLASAIDARYRGLGRGSLDLGYRSGQWQGDGTFTVTGFAVATDAPAIDGTVHAVLAGRRATLDASASHPQIGGVELAFEATAPRDPLDLTAWRSLDRGAIRNATIKAHQVELSGLAAIAGSATRAAQLTGTINGTINLAPADLQGGLTLRGVELPFGAIDGGLTLASHDGDLVTSAIVRLPGIAAADLTGRFALPERPFEPATWRNRGRDLLKDAAADLENVAFDPELLGKLGVTAWLDKHGISAPYRGHTTVQLALGAAATEARLAIEVNDVTGGALIEPISHHVEISASARDTHLTAVLLGHKVDQSLGLGMLDATVPMTMDRWLTEPAAVLRAPIMASWTLPVTLVTRILALFGRHDLDGGTLEGNATIRGTLGTPIIESARLLAHDVAVPPRLGGHPLPVLAELDVATTWGGASGSATIAGREATGGEFHAVVNGRPDALASVTGWLTATRLDIAPIAAVLSRPLVPTAGVVDADLRLNPGWRLAGKLHVASGTLPIAASIGTLRDVTADLAIADRAISGTLDGKLGRGTIHLEADVAGGKTIVKSLQLRNISAQSTFRPIINADVTATLSLEDGQVRGEATVKHARIRLPEHAGTPLLSATAPPDLVFVGTPEAAASSGPREPAHPWLVVDVALDSTQIEARNVVDSVGLGVQGTLSSEKLKVSVGDTVGVSGHVTIDNAYADILSRRYLLEPSYVEFDGTIDPRLDIHMAHQFSVLTLNVDVLGRTRTPVLKFKSDLAGYSENQLAGFFFGGEPGGDPSSMTGEAVKGAVALAISGKIGREISKVLPINVDAVSYEPATTATSASYTVGKWLTERLFLAYRQLLEPRSDEGVHAVQFMYRLGRKVLIEGIGGDGKLFGADLLWRHRW